MNVHARAALSAVLLVGSALAPAQSRPPAPRPHCPTLDPSVFGPPSSPSPVPYGGGAALAVGTLGIASRLRKRMR